MIEIQVASPDVVIEPGKTAQLDLTIVNGQDIEDNVAIELEGIEMEWYALPVPSVVVEPHGTKSARVIFRVPRSSDVVAGTYPFLVRARGMESGNAAVQQASLTVRPFTALQMDLEPKRATSSVFQRNPDFEIRISNLGNREETLDLTGMDPDHALAHIFAKDRVTLKPGAMETVPFTVGPRAPLLIGSPRLYQFGVTARSTEDTSVFTQVTGQLEHRAVLSTFTATFLVLLLVGLLGFWILRPRPVSIRSFTAEPAQVQAGEPVTLSWDIENLGPGSYIRPGNIPVRDPVGSVTVNPQETTEYALTARSGGRVETRTVTVIVTPKPPPPKVRILEFKADHRRIHQGDVVTLSWRVEGATALVLNPIGPLNARMDRSRQVAPETSTTYVLSAEGPGGDVVTKTVDVEVLPPNVCIAVIRAFRADPPTIAPGQQSTLRWSVEDAVRVELDQGIGTSLPARGTFVVTPATTTTYTLRAVDKRDNYVEQTVTVTVVEPQEPVGGNVQPPASPP